MCLTAAEVLNCNFTWTFVFTTSAGWVIREARTPARTPQLKFASGAEEDLLMSVMKIIENTIQRTSALQSLYEQYLLSN